MSCVRRRARQINRARGSGEEDRHSVGKEILPKFSFCSPLRHPALQHKIILTGFGPLQITIKIILDFRRARNPVLGPKSAPFSYTCPNYQMFLGKSNAFLTILKNRVRSRTRVQTFHESTMFGQVPSWIYHTRPRFRISMLVAKNVIRLS